MSYARCFRCGRRIEVDDPPAPGEAVFCDDCSFDMAFAYDSDWDEDEYETPREWDPFDEW